MSREKTLVKNTLIFAIGNFGSKVLTFLLLPFYTYYLSTKEYGYFDLITTTSLLIVPIVTFEIYDGVYRYLLDSKSDEDRDNFISNSVFITIRNLVVFSLIYLVFIRFVSFKYEYLILLQIDLNIISSLWSQIARGLKSNVQYSVSGILNTIITLVSNILFISVFKFKVGSLLTANIIAYVFSIVYLDYTLKIHKSIKSSLMKKEIRKELIKYSVPLIPNVVSWWLMNVSDRYFINIFKGVEANGIYAVVNKFPAIIFVLNNIFYLAWQESAITEYDSDDRDKFYTKMFNMLLCFELTLVVVMIAFTKFIMGFMVNGKFSSAWIYVPFLYFGTVFSAFSSFYGTGYLSSKHTIGAFYTSVAGGIVNVILNITLIPVIGIQGASFSTMVSYFVMWVIRIYQMRKYFKIHIQIKNLISLSIISIIFVKCYYIDNKLIQISMMISSTIIFIFFNWEIIGNAIKSLTHKKYQV
ncbi:MAG: polysaccharide biosynthesis C-terminal domain-containing protein [Bacillota bacterium]|nr:polysaccharide biosynthesis C-terminal domain-containing protein [Bacillota bacterium]